MLSCLNVKRMVALAAMSSLFFPSLSFANALKGVRVWPSPSETRVVIDLESEAAYSYFSLSSPNRLVVDLKDTALETTLPVQVEDSPVLKKIRKSGAPAKGTYRLVFELKESSKANLFKLSPTPGQEGYGHRLVIDLPHKASDVSSQASSSTAASSSSKNMSSIQRKKEVLIVIDAGHGGEDPGSIGPSRKYEKNAVLSISRKIATQLDSIPGIKTKMTRNGDYFVNLNRRVAIARENDAHLLISIHADAFTSPQPRGGSVFVLNTRRANTEIANWIENKERQSELLGGSGTTFSGDDKNVNQTLLDLQFSYSQKEGYKLATDILGEMGRVSKLHNSKPINTSLAVLRSPQIPSVLVETGFISNPTEEKLLFQRSHQDKLANAITKAVVKYLKMNPPEGTVDLRKATANIATDRLHKVKRGEFLSKIAQNYGISTDALIKANNLKSTSLAIGQQLIIPSDASSASSLVPSSTKTITHVVQSGEFLGKIANRYNVSVASLRSENNLKRDTLWVGQKLKITVKAQDIPPRWHKVKRGEYLGKIASKYAVSISSIRSANKLRSDELAIGQVLTIPHR